MINERISSVAAHCTVIRNGLDNIVQPKRDDVVIALAIRTPLCKSGRGGFKDTLLDGMVFKMLEKVISHNQLDPMMVDDICLGNVRDAKAAYFVRAASLAASFPPSTCSSHASRFARPV
ncbi:Hypothetical protein R9X50_00466700 [Acrodontium crateriforme]|uniref:Thiolase N-terminal domain-containing protein n=1 Tax=Acrodontium crateriforme TaxID=150365 RepID=A0AAQ3RCW4_9PEZI|nr:Hypothetical protein R9X50_00466700 [Acrodontium crateriforme]